MTFTYVDSRLWKYSFSINEGDLFIEVISMDEAGHQVHREFVSIQDGSLRWMHYHTRDDDPLVSEEARHFCEKSVNSFIKLKAFW